MNFTPDVSTATAYLSANFFAEHRVSARANKQAAKVVPNVKQATLAHDIRMLRQLLND